jgi:hypothetical protein
VEKLILLHTFASDFLDSCVEKFQLKIVSLQVLPAHGAQTKTWRKFAKCLKKVNEVPFGTLPET